MFPLTLKGTTLSWFMILGGNCIQTWEDMKHVFLKRYQDYCRVNENIFKMTQGEEESLEEYIKRFQYNLQISKQRKLGKETLKLLLLKGIQDEYLEVLNLMEQVMYFSQHMMIFVSYVEGIQKETSRLVRILRNFYLYF